MTRVELDEATASLSEYTRRARKGPESFVVSNDPGFVAMIERSRARYKPGTGIPLAEVMRTLGIKPRASRRSHKAR